MTKGIGRNATLALLTLIYLFNFMDRQIMSVLAEPIKLELGLSDTQLGLLTGFMFALFYTTFGVPVAWLADRTRRTWVIAAACALWSGFCAACAFATGFATLAAARIGVAVGEAGGVAPSYSLIAERFPIATRGRALAIYSLGVPLGLGAGTAAGGWIAASFGWRAAFVAVAAPGLVLAALLVLLVNEPARVRQASEARTGSLGDAIAGFVRSPQLVLVALSSALGAFACYGLMSWISAYLIRVLGMSLTEIGSWLSVTLAVGLGLGIWVSGALVDRLGARDRRMYALIPGAALALGAPVLFAATRIDDWHLALPLFGLALGLSIFYLAPSVAIVTELVAPEQRSTSSALMLLCLNLIGLGGGPFAIGAVSDWALAAHGTQSLRVALAALSPMFLVAALAFAWSATALARGEADARQAISAS